MRQEIHVETFKEFMGKSTNNDIDNILAKELLGSTIAKRTMIDTTLNEEQAKFAKTGMVIPQYLKCIELADGRIFKQEISISVDDKENCSMVIIEWKEKKEESK